LFENCSIIGSYKLPYSKDNKHCNLLIMLCKVEHIFASYSNLLVVYRKIPGTTPVTSLPLKVFARITVGLVLHISALLNASQRAWTSWPSTIILFHLKESIARLVTERDLKEVTG